MSEFASSPEPATVRLERLLSGPVERVWAYLTEPDKRAKWLAGGAMELQVGGRVELTFKHSELSAEPTPERWKKMEGGHLSVGKITRCEPPKVLAMTWGGSGEAPASEVTFELSPRGDKTLLVVTHRRLPSRKEMVSVAGGWDAHTGILQDVLEGREPRPFWATHARLEQEYGKRL